MNRQQALMQAVAEYDDGTFQADLARRVAFRTESEEAGQAAAQHAYLRDDMAPLLAGLGFACRIHDNPAGADLPILVARRIEDPALPTVLLYGHGDVVRGNAARWDAGRDPWTLRVEGDRWYGRGTADNKGQHSINLAALRQAIAARGGRLGFNAVWLIETGEEAGSPGLAAFCEARRDELAADVFLASDGPRLHAERPTLFMGSRGAVNFELSLRARERGYHSGNWGGLLSNPPSCWRTPSPRWWTRAVASPCPACVRRPSRWRWRKPWPSWTWAAARTIPPSTRIGRARPVGLGKVFGWNSLDVLTFGAGDPAKPVNAIPPEASAWCQLRFVVGTDWRALETHVREHLRQAGFDEVGIRLGAQAGATRLSPDNAWVRWAAASIERSTGKRPALLPNLGGSLPNDIFADLLGLPTICWVPHSYPACAQHAPNEHLLGSVAREGLAIMAGLFWDLGDQGPALRDAAAPLRP